MPFEPIVSDSDSRGMRFGQVSIFGRVFLRTADENDPTDQSAKKEGSQTDYQDHVHRDQTRHFCVRQVER